MGVAIVAMPMFPDKNLFGSGIELSPHFAR